MYRIDLNLVREEGIMVIDQARVLMLGGLTSNACNLCPKTSCFSVAYLASEDSISSFSSFIHHESLKLHIISKIFKIFF